MWSVTYAKKLLLLVRVNTLWRRKTEIKITGPLKLFMLLNRCKRMKASKMAVFIVTLKFYLHMFTLTSYFQRGCFFPQGTLS